MRLNASSCLVSPAARSAARWISSTSARRSSLVGSASEQELGAAQDDGQQVVEVVGDAARQLADGVHLLRLPELLLERAPLGDVEGDAGGAYGLAAIVEREMRDQVDPPDRAVRPDGPIFHFRGCGQLNRPRDPLTCLRPIILVDVIEERLEGLAEGSRRKAMHRLARGGPETGAGLEVRLPDADMRRLEGEAHPLFRIVQGSFCLQALGDVSRDPEQPDDLSRVVAYGGGVQADEELAAVAPPVEHLTRPPFAPRLAPDLLQEGLGV